MAIISLSTITQNAKARTGSNSNSGQPHPPDHLATNQSPTQHSIVTPAATAQPGPTTPTKRKAANGPFTNPASGGTHRRRTSGSPSSQSSAVSFEEVAIAPKSTSSNTDIDIKSRVINLLDQQHEAYLDQLSSKDSTIKSLGDQLATLQRKFDNEQTAHAETLATSIQHLNDKKTLAEEKKVVKAELETRLEASAGERAEAAAKVTEVEAAMTRQKRALGEKIQELEDVKASLEEKNKRLVVGLKGLATMYE